MKLGEAYVEITADQTKLTTGLNKAKTNVNKSADAMSKKLASIGKAMTIVGAVVTAAFALTVKSAMSFEKELAQISTMLDETTMKIMPKYKTGLQKLSIEFGEATTTLSRGLYDILSASIAPSKALDVLAIAATAATAGITDTGIAADAITTIINSYGMAAEDAGKVSDVLFATVKRGKTTFAELAPAIGKSAALAAQTGLSFEDLGATIATLTRAGIRIDEAMTSINGVLRAFLKPTDEAKEIAKEFGLELSTTTLKTIGMTGVMEKLKDATAEQLAGIFPNIRGLKGIAAAMGDAEGYAKDYALMLNSAGLTQEAFQKQSDTLAFKLGQLKQAVNLIAVTIGDILIPPLKDITESAVEIAIKIKEWADAHKPLMDWLVKIAAFLGVMAAVGGPILLAASVFMKAKMAVDSVTFALKLMNVRIGLTGALTTGTFIPALAKLDITVLALATHFLLVAANVYIWLEVFKEVNKILKSVYITTEDVKEAENRLAEAQWELAEKLGITVEELKEFQKAGALVSEMLGIELIPITEEANKTFEDFLAEVNKVAKEVEELDKRLSEMRDIMQPAEEAIRKILDTMTPYEKQLQAINKRYDEAIEKIKTYITNEEELKAAIDKLNAGRKAEIILLDRQKTALEKLLEAKQKIIDATKTLSDRIFELTHTALEIAIKKLDEERQSYLDLGVSVKEITEWYDLEIEKLKELHGEKDDAIDINKKLANSIKKMGKETEKTGETFNKLAKITTRTFMSVIPFAIKQATRAMSQFTLESVAAAIANIKMRYAPTIFRVKEAIRTTTYEPFLRMYEARLRDIMAQMQREVSIIMMGFREYQKILGGLIGGGGLISWQHGTPYVPQTGLAVVHKGEAIIPAAQNTYDQRKSYSNSINIQPGAINIVTPRWSNADGQELFRQMERQIKMRGLRLVRV